MRQRVVSVSAAAHLSGRQGGINHIASGCIAERLGRN